MGASEPASRCRWCRPNPPFQDETTDEWTIEAADLFRLFPVAYHIRFVLEAIEPLRTEMRELCCALAWPGRA
jgi:hypothetical protein